ncbi:MAG: ASCH domain-containing protein [Pirellulales bacterium]
MLLFKKKFLDAIRSGEKTQSIRLWTHCRMKAGMRSYIPGVGYIRIESVEPVALDRLSDEDARPDGFATAEALRAELVQIYEESPDVSLTPYRVVFSVFPPEDQAQMKRERQERKRLAEK